MAKRRTAFVRGGSQFKTRGALFALTRETRAAQAANRPTNIHLQIRLIAAGYVLTVGVLDAVRPFEEWRRGVPESCSEFVMFKSLSPSLPAGMPAHEGHRSVLVKKRASELPLRVTDELVALLMRVITTAVASVMKPWSSRRFPGVGGTSEASVSAASSGRQGEFCP
jgi:hypothetical protein